MITVNFTDGVETITSNQHLYQWDVGQILKISGLSVGSPKIHYNAKGDVLAYSIQSQSVGGDIECAIPDQVLQSGKNVTAYVYVEAGVAKYTARKIVIPVISRKKPTDYVETDLSEVTEIQSFLDNIIADVNTLKTSVTNINSNISTINGEISTLNTNTADLVIEKGVSGEWYYEKRADGRCTCNRKSDITTGASTNTYGAYRSQVNIMLPFAINIDGLSVAGYNVGIRAYGVPMDSTHVTLNFIDDVLFTSRTVTTYIKVEGTWK